jgi:hypothetical protein
MAPLPNADRAILDIRKLEDYCLSPIHPRGRHKARVFLETLGLRQQHAPWLRGVLLDGLLHSDAMELATDRYGARFRVDVPVARQGRSIVARTIWMTRNTSQSRVF